MEPRFKLLNQPSQGKDHQTGAIVEIEPIITEKDSK